MTWHSGTVIVGIGVDVVDVARFAAILDRTPGVGPRLLTTRERHHADGRPRPVASLAARFAAKEAVAKALGVPPGMQWHHCEVLAADSRRPELLLTDTVAKAAADAGVATWHLSLTHDGGVAIAYVVAESAGFLSHDQAT